MSFLLLALAQEAPPGFEIRRELSADDLRRGAFALFADSLAAAENALAPYRDLGSGLVVTFEETLKWRDLGRGFYHLGVPPALRASLLDLVRSYLDLLNAQLQCTDTTRQLQVDLSRAADDRAELVREFADLRANLLTEITERRSAERALQAAHDELDLRVRQRTAELATANAALETEAEERERANLALVEQRHRFDTLMENVPDSIYFKDEESRFVQINHALAHLFGLTSPKEAVGRTDFDFFAREHAQPAFDDEQAVMRTGQPITGKIELEAMPSGRYRWGLTAKMPLRDSEGRIIGTFGLTRDITNLKRAQDELRATNERLQEVLSDLTRSHEELKRAQLQLIQAEKMQSVGRLAAGIAHEVKNPLQILEMGLGCLASSPPEDDEQFPMIIKEMREAVSRASLVIGGLLDFSSSKELNMGPSDLNVVVEHSLRLVRHEFASHGVRVVRQLDPALPACRIDAHKIEQVLINILVNACQATPEGGTITVSTAARTLGAGEVKWEAGDRSGTRFREGQRVLVIEVRDTGPGIPAEKLGNIFEPFFTTKPTGQGTGLGLTVARKIIDLHNGRLDIDNAPGGGAVVTIVLKTEE